MRIYSWPGIPLSTSPKLRVQHYFAYDQKSQYQQNWIHPTLNREQDSSVYFRSMVNHLLYWRMEALRQLLLKLKVGKTYRCWFGLALQRTREHPMTNDHKHGLATFKHLVGMECSLCFSLTGLRWIPEGQVPPVKFEGASIEWKTFINTFLDATKLGCKKHGNRPCRAQPAIL